MPNPHEKRHPHPVLREILAAEHLRVKREVHQVVEDFFKRWGDDIFADEPKDPGRPLVLAVDHCRFKLEYLAHFLGKEGYRVSVARSGRVMLAKIAALKPRIIVTGLNVLHFYPPAYAWMLANLESEDAIPMLFVTGASARRIPQEIPKSARARVLSTPPDAGQLLRITRELA